jgi:hypothetical protein
VSEARDAGKDSADDNECEERVLAGATGQMAGLEYKCHCFVRSYRACARGHQESNLTLRSEDRSVANAPSRPPTATILC